MKIVFPVTSRNAPLYGQLANLFKKIGSQKQHSVMIISCPTVLGEAQTFAEEISKLFGTVEVETSANVSEPTGKSRNAMFRDAVYLLELKRNNSPWIWMEDAYPVDRDWLDMVQEEWNAKPLDRKFLGCLEKTYFVATPEEVEAARAKNPDLGEGPHYRRDGEHMRFGVYPPDIHFIVKGMNGLSASNIPFEVYLQGEIVPHCHPSKTVRTVWASKDFEFVGTGVKGQQSEPYEKSIRSKEKTYVDFGGVGIVHGCRDGSLGMILLRKNWAITPRKPSAPKKVELDTEELENRIKELEAENKALKEQLKMEPDTAAKPEPSSESQPAEEEKPVEATPPKRKRGRPRKKQPVS